MKIKYLSVLIALGLLSAAATGCGEKKESFDAAAYTQAFLDARIKGNTEEYAKLSGESPEDLAAPVSYTHLVITYWLSPL